MDFFILVYVCPSDRTAKVITFIIFTVFFCSAWYGCYALNILVISHFHWDATRALPPIAIGGRITESPLPTPVVGIYQLYCLVCFHWWRQVCLVWSICLVKCVWRVSPGLICVPTSPWPRCCAVVCAHMEATDKTHCVSASLFASAVPALLQTCHS